MRTSPLQALHTHVHSGINILGEIPWGSHFCEFYETEQDLLDILVLYFMEGLSGNECCFWISDKQLEHESIYQNLKKLIPGLDEMVQQNKMHFIIDDAASNQSFAEIIEYKKRLLQQGFAGIRTAGTHRNCNSQLSSVIEGQRIISLCCHALKNCNSLDIIDVIKNHDFSLIRRQNDWEVLEKASRTVSKNKQHKLNQELEVQVHERTETIMSTLHARDQLIAVASHELKTPIATFRLYIDGLLDPHHNDTALPEKTTSILKKIQQQSIDLEIMIHNLLDITCFQRDGQIIIHRDFIDLRQIAAQVITQMNEKLGKPQALVTLNAPDSVTGHWDGIRIKQVLHNLIENALKFSSNNPVEVTLSKKRQTVALAVKDKGMGIAKINQDYIFEQFIQLENNGRASGLGLGLGLWIVKQIVEAHQGKITVKSTLGKGATFIVTLPVTPAAMTVQANTTV